MFVSHKGICPFTGKTEIIKVEYKDASSFERVERQKVGSICQISEQFKDCDPVYCPIYQSAPDA